MATAPRDSVVWKLAGLLRESGDAVLSGCSTLSLLTGTLQQLNRIFELYLGPWGPGQTGFVALPSHPADSPIILQLQFLFDVLQKTLSLKLVYVPGPGLPGPIKIFPFKSLRQLELRGVPLHCLYGLRAIYSQLETLVCSRSIQALEELLSACGGDLCSALPWLALLSADFSYNALTALDSSLRLLSALRFLNLSHNQVQDCKGFLMDLSELCHLDVSYNRLHLVPRMGPSGAALGILILRGNELQSLHGLEQLRNLRHLDVAYNLLEGHRELSPLWLLTELRKLYLEGNPLWFHPEHRAATVQYLSPRARDAAPGFLLDGRVLSPRDFQTPASLGLGPTAPPVPWTAGSMTETSGGPELSDSLSSGGIVTQPPLRKVKSRVRVRRASISEPSDTDPEPRTLEPSPAEWFVQQRRELELLNSFRERFGCDWLQYRSHLETSGSPVPAASRTAALSIPPLNSPDLETLSSTLPSLPPAEKEASSPEESPPEMSEEGRLGAEPQEEEERAEQEKEEEAKEGEEQAQKEVAVELCRPMLVCPLQGPEGVRGRECFLRVTAAHLFEVELQAARTLERLELQCLEAAEVEPETPCLQEPEAEGSGLPPGAPVLMLHFSYICPDRRLRRYAVLEPDAHAAAQELLAVLRPVAGRAQQQLGEARDPRGSRFQCLRCGREFKPHSEEGWRPLFRMTESPAVCPHCGSDHVVLLALSGTTPTWEQKQGEPSPVPCQSLSPASDPSGHGDHLDGADGIPPQAPISHTRSSWSLSPPLERCGLRSVDHRLRLFLDVEVFGDAQEEFQCCVKVPAVLAGHTEFPCLVVVSDHRLYLLKVTGEIRGPPAGWLQPTLAIPLQDLSGIELGLAGQSLRLEWAAGAGGCVLLPRDARRCRVFLEELMDVLGSLPPTRRNCISAREEEVTPQHRLWPLLGKDAPSEAPQFFYLRVFLVEGPSVCPVSLLLTLSTLYLLDEDAAGPPLQAALSEASEKAPASGLGPSPHVRGQQPLSSLSSVLLYRTAPEALRLVFYDEVSRLESFWALRVVCREQLTALLAWIREPWEELFSIGLRTVTQEALDLDR
ncbi:serine/threonine-protein kinase 11-interacting protein [Lepus europaeus]|uniref:serine/threonine-protein kinase 11-interacting protein n=1 Tax=Lepus europaeus TaxID=9983 RepID=UPI002B49BFCE|nr:serine/threonine-protein kinase 11-interacting protein [Lepus europaeus]XP_062048675.1 serine/threonine-protein kinase 11-interacting protein [Lepus europaeus]